MEARKVIHVDMDAFYASVEQLDHPELRGLPIAVGGDGERGVVAAASYEARKYGVKSAMPSVVAKRRCPSLVFVKPRFERYKEISTQIRTVFYAYTDLVEPLSLDEAFLDVTQNKANLPSASMVAQAIRDDIYNKTGLTASAGISINKFLAKVASDIHKPNGQTLIAPEQVESFLLDLPIEKFFGVGAVTAEKMKRSGIANGADLKSKSLTYLQAKFGKSGLHYYNIVRGIHNSAVNPNRIRKSIAVERTLTSNLEEQQEVLFELKKIAAELAKRIEKNNAEGKTLTLKLKYSDFTIQSKSKTASFNFQKEEQLYLTSVALLENIVWDKPVRLVGLSLSNLKNAEQEQKDMEQLKLDFPDL